MKRNLLVLITALLLTPATWAQKPASDFELRIGVEGSNLQDFGYPDYGYGGRVSVDWFLLGGKPLPVTLLASYSSLQVEKATLKEGNLDGKLTQFTLGAELHVTQHLRAGATWRSSVQLATADFVKLGERGKPVPHVAWEYEHTVYGRKSNRLSLDYNTDGDNNLWTIGSRVFPSRHIYFEGRYTYGDARVTGPERDYPDCLVLFPDANEGCSFLKEGVSLFFFEVGWGFF